MHVSPKNENIYAKVISDSLHPNGVTRLTTMELQFHRFILPQVNTYRAFSRNSASSRAVPVKKNIASALRNPAWPVYFGKNKAGMQSGEPLSEDEIRQIKHQYVKALQASANAAIEMDRIGLHKEVINRILEPYLWHKIILSSTDFGNMFAQRIDEEAQPEFQELAKCMKLALGESKPTQLEYSQYHLPYLTAEDNSLSLEDKKKISIARCARVSYLTHDKKRSVSKDIELYNKLAKGAGVEMDEANDTELGKHPHFSPMEHVATPALETTANFELFRQVRKDIEESYFKYLILKG